MNNFYIIIGLLVFFGCYPFSETQRPPPELEPWRPPLRTIRPFPVIRPTCELLVSYANYTCMAYCDLDEETFVLNLCMYNCLDQLQFEDDPFCGIGGTKMYTPYCNGGCTMSNEACRAACCLYDCVFYPLENSPSENRLSSASIMAIILCSVAGVFAVCILFGLLYPMFMREDRNE